MLRKLLLVGKSRWDLNVGIISRIENNQYHVRTIDSDYDWINQGDIFELQNTYCRDVVNLKKTMTYNDAAVITDMLKHPCYINTQLRAYIGTPLVIDNNVWGTLNFSSLKPKQQPFTRADYRLIETLAEEIKKHLTMDVLMGAESSVAGL